MNDMDENLKLFYQYRKLAYKIANNASLQRPMYKDEIHSAAMYGLWEATKQKANGDVISLYSAIIKNHILYATRELNPLSPWFLKLIKKGEMLAPVFFSKDHAIHEDMDEDTTLQSEINNYLCIDMTIEDMLIKKEEQLEKEIMLQNAIDELSESQKEVMTALIFKGKTVRDLSEEYGCSDENINKKKRTAIEILKNKLN